MRLLTTLENEILAKKFSKYLMKEKIENTLDVSLDSKNKKNFNIWIHNEDTIEKAKKILDDFLIDPQNKKFEINLNEFEKKEEKNEDSLKIIKIVRPRNYKLTIFVIFTCIFLYFLNFLQELQLIKRYNFQEAVLLTPLQKIFLYDLPEYRVKLDDIIIQYNLGSEKQIDNPPKEAQLALKDLENEPSFNGFDQILLHKLQKKRIETGPLFTSIRNFEIYRILTPILLHIGILHILFNMFWVYYLGKLMEPRIGFFRYLAFILISAAFSNTAQYLMGGPYFFGYSGVITAMLGYIFVRQLSAPWEGYNISKAVFYFIFIFVLVMLVLQIVSFTMQIYNPKFILTPGIANTAHISGALIGMLLGKVSFFERRAF
ncbi:MAG: hypothetical protein A3F40_03145 [Chlamydiae bacterium RIFCSPHIGHO2_12_FULL_27_8]|nr:MAG: hypothetical protein A3F40_03145 [Chlamydiae bacterium RIFCSPHIGHO2_12_FULL_27_8]OGN64770.1 MAG: hypothetical protein A2888_01220 [Chlamydiae bacterium RIFCSPLOWO2_01_FULL_28_7]